MSYTPEVWFRNSSAYRSPAYPLPGELPLKFDKQYRQVAASEVKSFKGSPQQCLIPSPSLIPGLSGVLLFLQFWPGQHSLSATLAKIASTVAHFVQKARRQQGEQLHHNTQLVSSTSIHASLRQQTIHILHALDFYNEEVNDYISLLANSADAIPASVQSIAFVSKQLRVIAQCADKFYLQLKYNTLENDGPSTCTSANCSQAAQGENDGRRERRTNKKHGRRNKRRDKYACHVWE